MKVLVIAPLHDFPTTISNMAVSDLKKWMDENKIDYTLLRWLGANRVFVDAANSYNKLMAEKGNGNRFNAIFYYGHGRNDRLGDFFIDIVPIIGTKNIGDFKDMVIYTMSCLSGRELAPVAIQKGIKSYFGHTVRYFAFISNKFTNKELSYNKFVSDWITLVNAIPIRLMSGDSTGEAMRQYDTLAHRMHVSYLGKESNINRRLLYSNALHLELYGSRNAKIV